MKRPTVVEHVLESKDEKSVRELVDQYFDKIIWSVEKEEWEKMSDKQKDKFVSILNRMRKSK